MKISRKLGFTLIELLAVIVILAIIALIASPIVINLVEGSKKESISRSADGIIRSANNYYMNQKLVKESIVENIDLTGDSLDYDGGKPDKGYAIFNDEGNVSLVMYLNGYCVIRLYQEEPSVVKKTIDECDIEQYLPDYKDLVLNGADPVLGGNMIPVEIADNGTVTYADLKNEWYNYEDKKWANAVILSSGTYTVGDIIPESSIRAYFVWVPRYKYKIFNTGNYTNYIMATPSSSIAQEIEVVFETKDVAASNGSAVGSWLTHPAFTSFDVNGLWVGKFETGYDGATTTTEARVSSSNSSKIIVKPDVYSWSYNKIYYMFIAAYNFDRTKDSHMMKNTEWGAVAYLSHSKYGINKEININNNSSYKTGYSAASGTVQTTHPGTYGTDSTKTLGYNTETGYLASTTGNITGIYDMSGGLAECMASYKSGQLGSSGFSTATISTYNSKYFDVYSSSSTVNSYNYRILGDATGEMGPFYIYADSDGYSNYHNNWYADSSDFLATSYPWFARGAYYVDGIIAGQFQFDIVAGLERDWAGSRLVLSS